MIISRQYQRKQQGDITDESKSRQAKNYFRLTSTLGKEPTADMSYQVGEGRSRDIRYKIVNVRGTHHAIYVGLPENHKLYEANTRTLWEQFPDIEWSYASPDLPYGKSRGKIWWVGWISRDTPTLESLKDSAKTVISELAKGVLRGEIGSHH